MGRFKYPAAGFALGNKGFIGRKARPALSGYVIQAGNGGVAGFSATIIGWAGVNGTVGPGDAGVLVSGAAAVFAVGANFGYGDGQFAGFGGNPLINPYFSVASSNLFNQNFFTSVTINGHTYLTATADFFSNNGGCGPTLWSWQAIAHLVAGTQYSPVFA